MRYPLALDVDSKDSRSLERGCSMSGVFGQVRGPMWSQIVHGLEVAGRGTLDSQAGRLVQAAQQGRGWTVARQTRWKLDKSIEERRRVLSRGRSRAQRVLVASTLARPRQAAQEGSHNIDRRIGREGQPG